MNYEGPDRFHIEKDDRKRCYDRMQEWIPELKSLHNRELFLLAMAFGVKEGIRKSINRKDGFFFAKDLRDWELAIVNAVAIAETGDLSVLKDKRQVFEIAEEYANGGIDILMEYVKYGNYTEFIAELQEIMKELEEKINLS